MTPNPTSPAAVAAHDAYYRDNFNPVDYATAGPVERELWERVAQAVRDAEPAPRWVPVTERLPAKQDADPCGDVLWRYSTGYTMQGVWDSSHKERRGATHWMTIPPVQNL